MIMNFKYIVGASMPALGLVGIHVVFIGTGLQTWTEMNLNRCTSKDVVRDQSLVASEL
jgi:hypothetical protein